MIKRNWAAAVCAMLLVTSTAQAKVSPQRKCEAAKLKAQGKLQACLKKNSAKVLLGGTDGTADCQTKFQTALTKADTKATAASTSCRFIDNGDGTVSDLNTGLVWEQKTAGSGCPHCLNDIYTWSASGTAPDGTAFTMFLAALNNGASTDGGASTAITGCFTNHCDWRLPTVVELQGIVDPNATGCDTGSPCIDPAFGPTQANGYMSATTEAEAPAWAWFVTFNSGWGAFVHDFEKIGNGLVRAVRSGL
jgi:hypothetical protein